MPKVSSNISPDADLKIEEQEQNPNAKTAAAMDEYYAMKQNPDQYKRYSSFKAAVNSLDSSKYMDTFSESLSNQKVKET